MARTDLLYATTPVAGGAPAVRPARCRPWPWVPAVGAGAHLVLLALLTVFWGLGPVGWLAGTAYAVVLCSALVLALRRDGRHALGPADQVTLARAVLTGGVTALVADAVRAPVPATPLVGLTAVALALDAVDGQVARRTGTASALGARFDMEVDAFQILVLSVFVATTLRPWVAVIGAMRYVFVAASWALPWLNAPLPPSMARKTVAALQGIVLLVAASGLLPRPAGLTAGGVALAALVWSFGRDVIWLHRSRPGRDPEPLRIVREAGRGGPAESGPPGERALVTGSLRRSDCCSASS